MIKIHFLILFGLFGLIIALDNKYLFTEDINSNDITNNFHQFNRIETSSAGGELSPFIFLYMCCAFFLIAFESPPIWLLIGFIASMGLVFSCL